MGKAKAKATATVTPISEGDDAAEFISRAHELIPQLREWHKAMGKAIDALAKAKRLSAVQNALFDVTMHAEDSEDEAGSLCDEIREALNLPSLDEIRESHE